MSVYIQYIYMRAYIYIYYRDYIIYMPPHKHHHLGVNHYLTTKIEQVIFRRIGSPWVTCEQKGPGWKNDHGLKGNHLIHHFPLMLLHILQNSLKSPASLVGHWVLSLLWFIHGIYIIQSTPMSYSQKLLFCPLNKLKHAKKMSHETYPYPILSYWLVNK